MRSMCDRSIEDPFESNYDVAHVLRPLTNRAVRLEMAVRGALPASLSDFPLRNSLALRSSLSLTLSLSLISFFRFFVF